MGLKFTNCSSIISPPAKNPEKHMPSQGDTDCYCTYMEIHVFSLAYENKKGNQPNHDLDKETYIARDTWMPSLENWGGGLKS